MSKAFEGQTEMEVLRAKLYAECLEVNSLTLVNMVLKSELALARKVVEAARNVLIEHTQWQRDIILRDALRAYDAHTAASRGEGDGG